MDRTERLIADTLNQLLEEKPLNKISVKELVERCGINRNTFYYHFQDIPSLLEQIVKERADEIIRDHGRTGSLEDCVQLIIRYCCSNKRAILHIYRSVQRENFLNSLERLALYAVTEYIETATAGMEIPPEDKALLIRYCKCLLIGVSLDWLNSGMNYDLLAASNRMHALLNDHARQVFLDGSTAKP